MRLGPMPQRTSPEERVWRPIEGHDRTEGNVTSGVGGVSVWSTRGPGGTRAWCWHVGLKIGNLIVYLQWYHPFSTEARACECAEAVTERALAQGLEPWEVIAGVPQVATMNAVPNLTCAVTLAAANDGVH